MSMCLLLTYRIDLSEICYVCGVSCWVNCILAPYWCTITPLHEVHIDYHHIFTSLIYKYLKSNVFLTNYFMWCNICTAD
jgi:hypothetical protein